MFVSWRCSTYGREEFVPEIIEMFFTQDYKGKSELVILNDDPDIKYVFDHPDVRIYNWNQRFVNLRKKQNVCVGLCKGEVFIPIADDDLYAPWTTRTCAGAIGNDPLVAFSGFWKHSKNKDLHRRRECVAGLYACRTDFFKEFGGYQEWCQSSLAKGEYKLAAENFVQRVREAGYYKERKLVNTEIFFTWRRGFADHSMWNITPKTQPDKYVVKDRDPKIIRL